MTFSDAAVVDFVNRNFEAAWTSVAPINDIVVDIGNGRTVRGATNGEIALYVCRPDGKVIDVLPGLHTAQRTLDFLVEAESMLRLTAGVEEKVRDRLARTSGSVASVGLGESGHRGPTTATGPLGRQRPRARAPQPTDLRAMASKSVVTAVPERLLVVQPRGKKDTLQRQARSALSRSPLRDPGGWTNYIFEVLMKQPLEGGRHHIPSATPVTVRPR